MSFKDKIRALLIQKVKFALSSVVATGADLFIYLLLSYTILHPTFANIISSSFGMVINFFLQKKYVFALKGKQSVTFILSVLGSIVGMAISTAIIYYLTKYDFFLTYKFVPKIIAIGLIFFYNFYTKKYIFENRFNIF